MLKKVIALRWWIVALICLGTIINYLARNSLSVLAATLQTTLHFGTKEYSYVSGAFQLAYTVMQPVCGLTLDVLGLRFGFALFAVLWSLFNVLHAFAGGWLSLAAFRGLLGLSEASAIPAGIKAISEWFPAKERSVAVGFFNAGTSLGALLAPPLVAFVALAGSWRMAFIVTGSLGFIWAGLWWLAYRSPAEHPLITEEEKTYIAVHQEEANDASRGKPSMRTILRRPWFWGIAVPRFLAEPAWQTFNIWIPFYFMSVRHLDLKQFALFGWLPFLAADLGGILSGYLSPFLISRFGFELIDSRLAGIVLGAAFIVGPALVGFAADPFVAILLFSAGAFGHQMISALLNTLSSDLFARREVATANGLTGTAAWTGGLLFSLVVGQLADSVGFSPLFMALAIFDFAGATIAILLLRGRTSSVR